LVSEFLKSGAAYYSDDVDADRSNAGDLHPYPRDVSVRTQSNCSQWIPPEEFGDARAQTAYDLLRSAYRVFGRRTVESAATFSLAKRC